MSLLRARVSLAVATVVVLALDRPAAAQFEQLAAKIPDAANAAALFDVERLLETPLAKREEWKEKYDQAFASGLVAIAPDTRKLVLSAQFDFEYMKPLWEVAVADFRVQRSVAAVARATKGTLDPVGDTPAVVLRDDSYCVQLGPTRLGVMSPANRQSVARWLRQVESRNAPGLSPYLKGTLVASETSQIVIAFDLEDAVPLDIIRAKLEASSALAGKSIDLDAAAKALAAVRGLVLEVAVTDGAFGRLMVHFKSDAAVLAPVAKPLLLEIMGDMGARIDDMDEWKATSESQRLVFNGPLGKDGLKRVFSLIDSPISALKAMDTSSPARGPSQANAAARATQEYFKQVNSQRDRPGLFARALLNFLRHLGANTAQPGFAVLRLVGRGDEVSAGRSCPFRHNHNREMFTSFVTLAYFGANAFVVERDFGNQNYVGAARQASVDRDPAGVASHDFQHHDPPVAFGRAVQPIDGIRGTRDGRIESERHQRGRQIVVDCLRHAHDWDSVLVELLGNRQRAIAADRHEARQPKLLASAFGFVEQQGGQPPRLAMPHLGREFALVGSAQNRSTADEQAAEQIPFKGDRLLRRQQSLVTADDSQSPPPAANRRFGDRANHGVQSGTISSACNNTDDLRHARPDDK